MQPTILTATAATAEAIALGMAATAAPRVVIAGQQLRPVSAGRLVVLEALNSPYVHPRDVEPSKFVTEVVRCLWVLTCDPADFDLVFNSASASALFVDALKITPGTDPKSGPMLEAAAKHESALAQEIARFGDSLGMVNFAQIDLQLVDYINSAFSTYALAGEDGDAKKARATTGAGASASL